MKFNFTIVRTFWADFDFLVVYKMKKSCYKVDLEMQSRLRWDYSLFNFSYSSYTPPSGD